MYKIIGLYLFALLFLIAGIGHFLMADFFLSALPEWTPFPYTVIYLSGMVEILLALFLLYPNTRRKTGVLATVFLLLVFPVNIYMALTAEQYTSIPSLALWIRLPIQFVLIWWVLAVTKDRKR
ncbi:DoxX family protein [Paraliobacillus zengyii]|uniref:DoxX family protein n=1 Tax=Paraliobacillus zengyii TaxID=2213194 RepID=UPI000DD4D5E5|nr:DoxX family protein [Paraliobacillus zengyii]